MFRIVRDRLLQLFLVLFGVSVTVFLLLEMLPGDTAEALVASTGDSSPEALALARAELGLDQNIVIRFFNWIGNALQGDLGVSYRNGNEVISAIGDRLPASIQLTFMAELIALLIAVPAAMYFAARRDRPVDRVGAVVTFGLQSIPNFVVALLLILVLSVSLGWLPAIGYVPLSEDVWASIKTLLIPSLALAAGLIPVYIRVLRNELVRTLQEDYILVGRSVGLSNRILLQRYALRPALPTLVTVVGVNIGILLGGTVVVEVISGIPGLGTLMFNSITTLDYVMVQGIVLVIAAAYVVINFLVDMLHLVIDPKVRA